MAPETAPRPAAPPADTVMKNVVADAPAPELERQELLDFLASKVLDAAHLDVRLPEAGTDLDAAAQRLAELERQKMFRVTSQDVTLGEILPPSMLRTDDGIAISPDVHARIAVAGPLSPRVGTGGTEPLKTTCSAGYWVVKPLPDPSVTQFQVGPYGTGSGHFGASSCALPSDPNDPFPQIWRPYNYGTAVLDPSSYSASPFGDSCQNSLARNIGAVIDIQMSGATVYRAWGTDLDGGANYHKPIVVSVTDSYDWYLVVHDDGTPNANGECMFLQSGVTADYALFGVRLPNRSVEFSVTSAFSNLLTQRSAVSDPAAAVHEASQQLFDAGDALSGDFKGLGAEKLVEYSLAHLTGDPDLASATMSIWDLVDVFLNRNLLGLVMTSWLGNLYDSAAYIASIEQAEQRTSQAYFVASLSTALSGVGDLLRQPRPYGEIYTSRPDGTHLGFALSSTTMDDWARWDDDWVPESETPWPALDYGAGLALGSLGMASCCLPAGWTEDELAANGYLAGHFLYFLNFYQARHSGETAVALFADTGTTAGLFATVQLLNFFQIYQVAGYGTPTTETDFATTNWAPEVGIMGALQAILYVYADQFYVWGYAYDTAPSASLDSDGDELSDADEASYGTQVHNPDTDGDGVMDGTEVELGRSPTIAQGSSYDSDGDGLSDLEELDLYHTDASVAQTDLDFDGLLNSDEKYYGTDPSVPDSDGDNVNDGDEIHVHATGALDSDSDNDGLSDGDEVFTYFSNPKSSDSDGDGLSDGDEVGVYGLDPARSDSNGDGNSDWWEINVKDTDGDGLTDWSEVHTYNTDPADTDSDDDGLTDGDEVNTYGTDPTDADSDDDGLTDSDEINTYGTDPTDADSDDDGLTDGDEINTHGTYPLDADSDDDGLTDGDEVNTYGTDPLDADSDDDGTSDGDEVAAGTDPLVNESLITGRCGTTSIFNHAPGNTYNKAVAQVYLPAGMTINSATITGQGHNQDSVGYVRTMVVEVNGNVYTVLPWLLSGQTQSFTYTLPAGVLTAGWNEVKAYIHWGNDSYDNGHWVTVDLELDAQCVEASGYGTTNVFTQSPGNTYNKATMYVHVDESTAIGTVRVTGQGHNQDSVGYARVMRVEINGNVYTVISWLSYGQTGSFNYTVPAGVLTNGWNEIKAYIHWGDDTYDNGHWVTVDLVLDSP